MIPFNERAVEMGLEEVREGLYRYQDQYSEVVYRGIQTPGVLSHIDESHFSVEREHDTDLIEIPYYAIFTRPTQEDDFTYCGLISRAYKFMGNDVIIQRARDSIMEIGIPIMEENIIYPPYFTRMRDEILISNGINSPEVGDVLPVMIVHNTYDGTGAAKISFGIAIIHNTRYVTFAFSLGELRQVHIDSSRTSMTAAINDYIKLFNEDISDMITQSFNHTVSEEEMLGTLDVIEELGGKKRRSEIASIISEISPPSSDGQVSLPSSWGIFVAIVRYSSLEPNLNVKRLLENAAERVLVIPGRMYDVLRDLSE